MICPVCGSTKFKVLGTRKKETNNSTRRRKECQECFTRFTTFETIDFESIPSYIKLRIEDNCKENEKV